MHAASRGPPPAVCCWGIADPERGCGRLDVPELYPLGRAVGAAEDGECPGEVLVFAQGGHLSWLEVCSWSDR
ncbi:hypothetical protein AB0O64_35685 [Streptomyces sp. NPDC088341]|uniref:hypothetical protein n=1 Tax=Streptomyces sp. NPDC088341 TaxID=3154870 RepID=UPI00341ADBC0